MAFSLRMANAVRKCQGCSEDKALSCFPVGARKCTECERTEAAAEMVGKPLPDGLTRRQEKRRRYRRKHAEKLREDNRRYRAAYPERFRGVSRGSSRGRIGFTQATVIAAMEAQSGRCAICEVDLKSLPPKKIHADHDHATGEHRGLLCSNCNAGIGFLKDSRQALLAAVQYLDNPPLRKIVGSNKEE